MSPIEIKVPPINADAVLNAMRDQLQRVVEDLATFCLTEAKKNLALGQFKDGPGVPITFEGTVARSGRIEIGDLEVIVIFDAVHAVFVEFGTRPRTKGVPIKPLERWVRLKLGISDAKLARQVAFAISNTIKKRGTKPKPFFRAAAFKTTSKRKVNEILTKHGFSS